MDDVIVVDDIQPQSSSILHRRVDITYLPDRNTTGGGAQNLMSQLYVQQSEEERSKLQKQKAEQELEALLDADVGCSHTDSHEQTFTDYQPKYVRHEYGFVTHPDTVNETSSLSSVSSPNANVKLCLPSRTILEGHLTSLQCECILFAVAQHQLRLPNGCRAAFFMGDGPGMGKGRQLAGIILDSFLRCSQTKALWFSISSDLMLDARRDLADIGAGGIIECHDLRDYKAHQNLCKIPELESGVMFSSYSLLVSGAKAAEKSANTSASRLNQIVQWCGGPSFNGCLVLDECHRAKNMGTFSDKNKKGDKQTGSKAALCVQQLQERLPLARVVYVSATGASEPQHMACFSRLGLWGKGTSFPDVKDFLDEIKRGGVGAMELLAMHMKAQGQYLSRSLSFKGATFEICEEVLPQEFVQVYDSAAEVWDTIVAAVNNLYAENPQIGKSAKSVLWSYHQRFWGQLVMAAKVAPAVRLARQALQEGKCVVIGLQSTGEAGMVEAGDKDDDEALSSSSKHILLSYIKKWLAGAADEQLVNKLLKEAAALRLPTNPLDDLIHQLGGKGKVAEMTGRSTRLVKTQSGMWITEKRVKQQGNSDAINVQERKAFQSGQKLIAIISEAASTGISLQADRRAQNQRRRMHITLQLPWSADQVVQQMGRSHRSNQSSAPEFKLLMTNIGGEWRFASAVAKRLQSLGALSQGDRRASGGAQQMGTYSIESNYGMQALENLERALLAHNLVPPAEINTLSFLSEDYKGGYVAFVQKARAAMEATGIAPDGKKAQKAVDKLKRFLNRILGMKIETQNQLFGFFSALLQRNITAAKRDNTYSEGIVDIAAENIAITEEIELYKCARTNASTRYVKVASDRGVSFEKAEELLKGIVENGRKDGPDNSGFYRQRNSPDVYLLALKKQSIGIGKGFYHTEMHWSDLNRMYEKVSGEDAQKRWQEVYDYHETKCGHIAGSQACAGPQCTFKARMNHSHIISGFVLPFWSLIQRECRRNADDQVKVVRVNTSESNRRVVGLLIHGQRIDKVKKLVAQGLKIANSNLVSADRVTPDAFFEVTSTLLIHDCLSPSGMDCCTLELPFEWNSDPRTKIHARMVEIPFQNLKVDRSLEESSWTYFSLFVNDKPVPLPKPQGSKRQQSVFVANPVCINEYVNPGTNTIKIFSKEKRCSVIVQIGRDIEIDQVVDKIKTTCINSREDGETFVCELIENSQAGDELEVTLRCPISRNRIELPCRGSMCEHFQCFDLKAFLQHAKTYDAWKCPVSGCPLMLSPLELTVDALFSSVLEELDEDCFKCLMQGDGNFVAVEEDEDTLVDDSNCDEGEILLSKVAAKLSSAIVKQECGELSLAQLKLLESGLWEYSEEAEKKFMSPPRHQARDDDDLSQDSEADSDSEECRISDSEGLVDSSSDEDEDDVLKALERWQQEEEQEEKQAKKQKTPTKNSKNVTPSTEVKGKGAARERSVRSCRAATKISYREVRSDDDEAELRMLDQAASNSKGCKQIKNEAISAAQAGKGSRAQPTGKLANVAKAASLRRKGSDSDDEMDDDVVVLDDDDDDEQQEREQDDDEMEEADSPPRKLVKTRAAKKVSQVRREEEDDEDEDEEEEGDDDDDDEEEEDEDKEDFVNRRPAKAAKAGARCNAAHATREEQSDEEDNVELCHKRKRVSASSSINDKQAKGDKTAKQAESAKRGKGKAGAVQKSLDSVKGKQIEYIEDSEVEELS